MEIVWILIPISLVLVGVIAWAFLWAVNSGQFDDLDGPGTAILMDDDKPAAPRDGSRREEDP
jgi:cbb3-type cytochrome oxidase maturation protein